MCSRCRSQGLRLTVDALGIVNGHEYQNLSALVTAAFVTGAATAAAVEAVRNIVFVKDIALVEAAGNWLALEADVTVVPVFAEAY